jgi:SOS response regulatory protein OraA/RecX
MSEDGYRAALRWLARRPLTAKEVHDRLSRTGVEGAEQVVVRLRREGWLSDEAVVDQEVRRAQATRHGPRYLEQRLRQRGVRRDLIAEALARWPADDAYRQALEWARRDPSDRGRVARRLERRGYRTDDIRRVLKELDSVDRPEELDSDR